MHSREPKHWGWGFADEQPTPEQLREAAAFLCDHLGFGSREVEAPAPLPALPAPRLAVPPALRELCDVSDAARARHAYGRSYRDVVRGFRGSYAAPPDVVARPGDDRELEAVLEWALGAGAAVIPYGGGTSVVGGVEPVVDGPAVSVDVQRLDRVLDVDPVSGSARIQAGATGPGLEAQLGEHGLTLRHFPQSFQLQTLGGAIATRAGGHFATGPTHIDDFVESVRALTPAGWWESRRLPGSGAGVSPDRLLLGSEGVLGIISEAWVRVLPRPSVRASRAVRFPGFAAGAAAARAIAQSGLRPANCRLIDPEEARLTFAGDGSAAVLLVGFESAGADVGSALNEALRCCEEHGGSWDESPPAGGRGAADSWRDSFVRAPYLRDTFVAMGVVSETFESAITWDRFEAFVQDALEAARAAVREVCGAGHVTCRLTHVYADGAAPYFTVLAPARRGEELDQWAAIKAAASDAVLAAGGTITHHHAVGRDHRPWYDQQRPDPFAVALRGAKAALDPGWQLNPGVLIDPPPPRG
jgi:alkyldihydroxyacetonephosphate synthase